MTRGWDTGKATTGRNRVRRIALLLALFAVALRLATPSWATTVERDAHTGLRTVTICTGVGYEVVTIDAAGRRVQAQLPTRAPRDIHHDCVSCCMRLAQAMLPAPVALAARTAYVVALPQQGDARALQAAPLRDRHARSPPSA